MLGGAVQHTQEEDEEEEDSDMPQTQLVKSIESQSDDILIENPTILSSQFNNQDANQSQSCAALNYFGDNDDQIMTDARDELPVHLQQYWHDDFAEYYETPERWNYFKASLQLFHDLLDKPCKTTLNFWFYKWKPQRVVEHMKCLQLQNRAFKDNYTTTEDYCQLCAAAGDLDQSLQFKEKHYVWRASMYSHVHFALLSKLFLTREWNQLKSGVRNGVNVDKLTKQIGKMHDQLMNIYSKKTYKQTDKEKHPSETVIYQLLGQLFAFTDKLQKTYITRLLLFGFYDAFFTFSNWQSLSNPKINPAGKYWLDIIQHKTNNPFNWHEECLAGLGSTFTIISCMLNQNYLRDALEDAATKKEKHNTVTNEFEFYNQDVVRFLHTVKEDNDDARRDCSTYKHLFHALYAMDSWPKQTALQWIARKCNFNTSLHKFVAHKGNIFGEYSKDKGTYGFWKQCNVKTYYRKLIPLKCVVLPLWVIIGMYLDEKYALAFTHAIIKCDSKKSQYLPILAVFCSEQKESFDAIISVLNIADYIWNFVKLLNESHPSEDGFKIPPTTDPDYKYKAYGVYCQMVDLFCRKFFCFTKICGPVLGHGQRLALKNMFDDPTTPAPFDFGMYLYLHIN